MLLDNTSVYSAPLSDDLAAKLQSDSIRQLYASTGTGKVGTQQATNLEIHLRAGALPVDVTIAGSGGVSAPLGERYKMMVTSRRYIRPHHGRVRHLLPVPGAEHCAADGFDQCF